MSKVAPEFLWKRLILTCADSEERYFAKGIAMARLI